MWCAVLSPSSPLSSASLVRPSFFVASRFRAVFRVPLLFLSSLVLSPSVVRFRSLVASLSSLSLRVVPWSALGLGAPGLGPPLLRGRAAAPSRWLVLGCYSGAAWLPRCLSWGALAPLGAPLGLSLGFRCFAPWSAVLAAFNWMGSPFARARGAILRGPALLDAFCSAFWC